MPDHFRPFPFDPGAEQVLAMFDVDGDWLMATTGDVQVAAVAAMAADGTDLQHVVAVELPARRNHTDEHVTVRLMISPDDALSLAELLGHSARWLKAHS